MRKNQHKDYIVPEAKYPINFTQPKNIFVLSLHYNGSNSFLFVNNTKIYQFKAKDIEIKDYIQCLDNISQHFTMNKTGLKSVKSFSC